MTKRELCIRLMNIRDRMAFNYADSEGEHDHQVAFIKMRSAVVNACDGIREILLDIAAPEEDDAKRKEEPKSEVEKTGPTLGPREDGFVSCPKCGYMHEDKGEWWTYFCPRCEEWWGPHLKREEEEEVAPPSGFIIKADGNGVPGETDVCLKCGGPVRKFSGDCYYCAKCGVSFRLKRGEGEK